MTKAEHKKAVVRFLFQLNPYPISLEDLAATGEIEIDEMRSIVEEGIQEGSIKECKEGFCISASKEKELDAYFSNNRQRAIEEVPKLLNEWITIDSISEHLDLSRADVLAVTRPMIISRKLEWQRARGTYQHEIRFRKPAESSIK